MLDCLAEGTGGEKLSKGLSAPAALSLTHLFRTQHILKTASIKLNDLESRLAIDATGEHGKQSMYISSFTDT